ncbi:WXG100 family type VII secretion target [Paractinoplanes atraurantiacus]|uniref:Uncharacterized protein n=1 Tax=Paractinoplanes atraurantiacus TaxID=1036182 RepID=A0A285KB61_9ACTN|nr:WXG100 family type VII secretion target [Actinoplanes atraurantiacus]SNY69840.1 hypothetical protein SAMN05421748_13623 [Actinoplanes atraurantiacus]
MPLTPQPPNWEAGLQTVFGVEGLDHGAIVDRTWISGTGTEWWDANKSPWYDDPLFGQPGQNNFTLYKKAFNPHAKGDKFYIVKGRVDWFEGDPSSRAAFDKMVLESQMVVDNPQNKLDPQSYRNVATTMDNLTTWLAGTLSTLQTRRNDLGGDGSGFQGSAGQAFGEYLTRLSMEFQRLETDMNTKSSWAGMFRDAGTRAEEYINGIRSAWNAYKGHPGHDPTTMIFKVLQQLADYCDQLNRGRDFGHLLEDTFTVPLSFGNVAGRPYDMMKDFPRLDADLHAEYAAATKFLEDKLGEVFPPLRDSLQRINLDMHGLTEFVPPPSKITGGGTGSGSGIDTGTGGGGGGGGGGMDTGNGVGGGSGGGGAGSGGGPAGGGNFGALNIGGGASGGGVGGGSTISSGGLGAGGGGVGAGSGGGFSGGGGFGGSSGSGFTGDSDFTGGSGGGVGGGTGGGGFGGGIIGGGFGGVIGGGLGGKPGLDDSPDRPGGSQAWDDLDDFTGGSGPAGGGSFGSIGGGSGGNGASAIDPGKVVPGGGFAGIGGGGSGSGLGGLGGGSGSSSDIPGGVGAGFGGLGGGGGGGSSLDTLDGAGAGFGGLDGLGGSGGFGGLGGSDGLGGTGGFGGLGGPGGLGGAGGGFGGSPMTGASSGFSTFDTNGAMPGSGLAVGDLGENPAADAGGYPPYMPPMTGTGDQDVKERERKTWLDEDEEVWGTAGVSPAVIGRDEAGSAPAQPNRPFGPSPAGAPQPSPTERRVPTRG